MPISKGSTSSRKGRGGRPILGLPKIEQAPDNRSKLPGTEPVELSTEGPEDQFEAALWRSVNAWDIGRRSLPTSADAWLSGGGFAGRGKLTRTQANDLLTRAFKALDGAR